MVIKTHALLTIPSGLWPNFLKEHHTWDNYPVGHLKDVFYNESAHGEYRVYWTNDGSTVPLSLPAGTSAVYDKFGQDITPGGGTISVDFEPIFIETAP